MSDDDGDGDGDGDVELVEAIASPGEESGDSATAVVHIEKVELRMENVRKRYGGRQVVDGMSMSLRLVEMPGLLGPNGAGKESSVFGGLSVHDDMRLIREETGVPRARHGHRVQDFIEEFSFLAVENIMGGALSGGERRRTELARALASNCAEGPPNILLVDEPFAGVDPIGVAEIQKQLRRLCNEEELGVLITDYNMNESLSICDPAQGVCHGFRRS